MPLSREQAAALGEATRHILAEQRYTNSAGEAVELSTLLKEAQAGTRSYPHTLEFPMPGPGIYSTDVQVTNESTLVAAQRLVLEGYAVAALNFASARHPGGGWLSGARAQEESLARASGLVPCIEHDPMYAQHAAMRDALYTSSAIYSPMVPVFRDDDGRLLDEPYCIGFITAAAVNAGVVLERDRRRKAEVTQAMRERIMRVLAIAVAHKHTALVLGAWGCGVFKNDPAEIARLFAEALNGPFSGVFEMVIFAVLDWSPEKRFIGPFARTFLNSR